jgi:beta-lactamase superfamily II metal-dependent hydrolase
MHYKRKKIISIVLCLLMLAFIPGCSCACGGERLEQNETNVYKGFSVHYLNVGQGDCIFIRLPDGKNILIDTGDEDLYNKRAEYIINYLKAYSVQKIDYFVLTHPDADHVGNADSIIDEFKVEKAFVPHIAKIHLKNYPYFEKALTKLENQGADVQISEFFKYVSTNQYFFTFLSPTNKDLKNSSYYHFNGMLIPDEKASNDLSPIIYLEALGNRFLFTGDASSDQEKLVLDNYKSSIYSAKFNRLGLNVNLEDIDYYKVGHHGADTSTCGEFLSITRPKNAIISVGGDNFYGHPKTATLERLELYNHEYNLFRTDYHGTIVVHEQNNKLIVSTQLN